MVPGQRSVTAGWAIALVLAATPAAAQEVEGCLECHGSTQQVVDAAAMLEVQVTPARAEQLTIHVAEGWVHEELGCVTCHPGAAEVPHVVARVSGNPCVECHGDITEKLNRSAHGDPAGGVDFQASCWDCHTAHGARLVHDPDSPVGPLHVAERCLACHDKGEYLTGVHGFAVQRAGLDFAATCVSCHGAHDVLSSKAAGSRTARRNVSGTCGSCHARVAEAYRRSVHGAALSEEDNPDVPTCVDCHEAHGTVDPRTPRFRLASPDMCARCHADEAMMGRYGISTAVFDTYVADFHGTTAELFKAASPDQPLNKAVCYDCHGFHDVVKINGTGAEVVEQNLLLRCQVCHPDATSSFLSAWTGHYVPSPDRYALIYYVRLFYQLVIPATVGFFLLYIGVDAWGRRRHRRSS